jgi:hypothetical protein
MTGMGSLLNLDLSQSSSFSRDAGYESGRSQAGDENKAEAADDYSQTFKPVIQPGWSFAPEKSTPGLGWSAVLYLNCDTSRYIL